MINTSQSTQKLDLPYIIPSQAQKHVTHNEAIRILDALVRASILAADLAAPPLQPMPGDGYIIANGAADEWLGHDQELCFFIDDAWMFFRPKVGWRVWDHSDNCLKIWHDDVWQIFTPDLIDNMKWLGINATANDETRLAVSASSSLFNHSGEGHQLKINKSAVSDTASVLFQSGFSGRAELGLPGNDNVALKVSPDGETWLAAMSVDVNSGSVNFPCLPAAVATLGGGWKPTQDGSKTGFTQFQIQQGGFNLGEEIAPGMGNYLVVPKTGLYSIWVRIFAKAGDEFRVSVFENQSGAQPFFLENNHSATKAYTQDASTILALSAGDALCFKYSGASELFHAPSHTQLCLSMLS